MLVVIFVAVGWFLRYKNIVSHPVLVRHFKIIKINDIFGCGYFQRKDNTCYAIIKKGIYQQGVDELIDAINICPINTDAYVLLAKAYLLAGHELRAYYVLDRAGDSFADFNQIIGSIDDTDLNLSPWMNPKIIFF